MNDDSMYKGGSSRLLSLISQRPMRHRPLHTYQFDSPLVVLLGAVGIGSAILSLETNSLVDKEVTRARVARGADGETDDNA
jgi:hypothetical protein